MEMVREPKLSSLASFLKALDEAPPSRESYDALLERIGFDIEEVRAYCHFSSDFYTRNLIARTEHYEVMTLCWEPGQMSPVHDHAGSDGWVCAMDGAIEEVRYQCKIAADGTATVVRGDGATLGPGGIGYINDDIAWHTVGNGGDTPAVSLHLYSPPIDACQYVDSRGRVQTKQMSYFTDARERV